MSEFEKLLEKKREVQEDNVEVERESLAILATPG